MEIALVNVEVADHLSEETTAFTADIALDGEVVAHARGDGRGGCHRYHPTDREAFGRLEAWAEERYGDVEPVDAWVNEQLQQREIEQMADELVAEGYPVCVVLRSEPFTVGDETTAYGVSQVVGLKREDDIATLVAAEQPDDWDVVRRPSDA